MRVYNFSAGPAMLPLEVLEQAKSELTDWQGSGMSVMEVSHRSKAFIACAEQTEALLREIAAIPDSYRVLFLQGGAMGQFSAVPMNLSAPGQKVDFLHTGSWSAKAIAEAKRYDLDVRVLADMKESGYTDIPEAGSFAVDPDAAYLHFTTNETIGGVAFDYVPDGAGVPVVTDMSSSILSAPMDVARHGVIYAGAQKNMGPAGICVVIVRDDLLDRARPDTPSVWSYATMAKAGSMVNTPPTFSLYLLGLILAWVKRKGGLQAMAARNEAKASELYRAIDVSPFYSNPVAPRARSRMNVPFVLADPGLDKTFLAEAAANGFTNLAGHRSVGGMRASIYNAMPAEGVAALIDFMKEFERRYA